MVTDQQVRKLMKLIAAGAPLVPAALKAGMDPKTARKYRCSGQLPGTSQQPHSWRTRADPFAAVWEELRALLVVNPGLQAQTLFAHLQRQYPGRFADGQLRTLQRKLKAWRAVEGPAKEIFFPQVHPPGELAASDFCHLTGLGVTIAGQSFPHLLYHFVLCCSNWETGLVCFAESFESLSAGLQQALWELGGVPLRHRTDSLSAAVQLLDGSDAFTRRYQELLAHYGLKGEHIQPGRAHENGDVEQRHHRFKVALDQALMLRGSRDFAGREAYEQFLRELFVQLNAGRRPRLAEEVGRLRPLPGTRLDVARSLRVKVGPGSTIRVLRNTYSVPSRLIGEAVEVRVAVEQLEVWYGQRLIERLPRLRGRDQHRIEYRHVIDWLVRKPGAFAQYRYRGDLFPTSRFRIAYDTLVAARPQFGEREYLRLLHLAARETEAGVDAALRALIDQARPISAAAVQQLLTQQEAIRPATEVRVSPVDLRRYDALLSSPEAVPWN
jgi:transposase InsO family protein